MEHTALAVTPTTGAEPGVGATSKVVLKVAGLVGCVKLMVWLAFCAATSRATLVSSEERRVGAEGRARGQAHHSNDIVTVPLAIEHTPLAVTPTTSPELAVGATPK